MCQCYQQRLYIRLGLTVSIHFLFGATMRFIIAVSVLVSLTSVSCDAKEELVWRRRHIADEWKSTNEQGHVNNNFYQETDWGTYR
jgi:hypothetical protein